MRLAALAPALAGQAAGADRDLRLDDVPAGAERIGFRIEEGQDAVLLVGPQEPIQPPARAAADAAEASADPPPGRPARNSANAPLAATSMAVPKSGCSRISPVGTPMISAHTSTRAQRAAAAAAVQVPGHHHRHAELQQFGGLEVEHAEVDPVVPCARCR